MPGKPHRFGCGEIATGFKPAGFPPGFFNPSRICPKPGGTGKAGGGGPCPGCGGGGGGRRWRCREKIKQCYTRGSEYFCPQGQYPCIRESSCYSVPISECTIGVNCYASEKDCNDAQGNKPDCRDHDKCEKKGPPPKYNCVETVRPCTNANEFGTYIEKNCAKCGIPGLPKCVGLTSNTIEQCEKTCKNTWCGVFTKSGPQFVGPPTPKAHYSCVEAGGTTPCYTPGSTGSGWAVPKVSCSLCKARWDDKLMRWEYKSQGVGAGKSPGKCLEVKADCDTDCVPDDCPTIEHRFKCYEEGREVCEPASFNRPEYKVTSRCQKCECWTNPTTSVRKCYVQNLVSIGQGKVGPQGRFVNETECSLTKCSDRDTCRDVPCPPGTPGTPTAFTDDQQ